MSDHRPQVLSHYRQKHKREENAISTDDQRTEGTSIRRITYSGNWTGHYTSHDNADLDTDHTDSPIERLEWPDLWLSIIPGGYLRLQPRVRELKVL